MNHAQSLSCSAKHVEAQGADNTAPAGQSQAGLACTGPSMSPGRGSAAFCIFCRRYSIPESSLFVEELGMDGGTGGIWVLLSVWEHLLQGGVLECMWMAWESAVPVLWGRAVMAHCWALELIFVLLELSALHLLGVCDTSSQPPPLPAARS